jgi:hypothetical protein
MMVLIDFIITLAFLFVLTLIADGMGAFGGKWRFRNFVMEWLKSSGS